MGDLRGLVLACARTGDELCGIAGGGCPYTLPIAGRPLIRHAIRSLSDAGASEILIAAAAEILEDLAVAVGDPGLDIRYSIASEGAGETEVLKAALIELGPGPVLVHPGDMLLPEGFGTETRADGVEGAWTYDGTVDGVLEANQIALDQLERSRIGADLSNATVQGRVQIHPTAVLDGAKVRGPVYIGPEAVIVETYVGPYTSISGGVRLEGVEIEHSIVLPGASILYPGRRIEASLVGEGAQIARDFSLPSAIRLRVGRGADIQLS